MQLTIHEVPGVRDRDVLGGGCDILDQAAHVVGVEECGHAARRAAGQDKRFGGGAEAVLGVKLREHRLHDLLATEVETAGAGAFNRAGGAVAGVGVAGAVDEEDLGGLGDRVGLVVAQRPPGRILLAVECVCAAAAL